MAELIKGETGEWEIVIGMEVHAQVVANSKLFSGASLRRPCTRESAASLASKSEIGAPLPTDCLSSACTVARILRVR